MIDWSAWKSSSNLRRRKSLTTQRNGRLEPDFDACLILLFCLYMAVFLCQLVIFLYFKTLDDTKPVYTEEELQRFEVELRDREVELGRRAEKLQQEQELLKERSKALEAQKREYQQVKDWFQLVAALVFLVLPLCN